MAAYVASDSLLLGGIPTRSELSMDQFVNDAADEIDSILGLVYETPIANREDGLPIDRPVRLLLARVNRYLATGRYILAVASSGEDNGLHTYGARLIREALDVLRDIGSEKIRIDARRLPNEGREDKGPKMVVAEAHSNVDAFYGAYTGSDGMMFGAPGPYNLGRLESESGG